MMTNLDNFGLTTDIIFMTGTKFCMLKENFRQKGVYIEGQLIEFNVLVFVAIVTTLSTTLATFLQVLSCLVHP